MFFVKNKLTIAKVRITKKSNRDSCLWLTYLHGYDILNLVFIRGKICQKQPAKW